MTDDWGQPRIKWLDVGIVRKTWSRERDDGAREELSALCESGVAVWWTASVSVSCDTREQAEEWLRNTS